MSPLFEFDVRFLACFLDVLEEAAGQDHVPVGEVTTWCWRAKESICLWPKPLEMVKMGEVGEGYLSRCGDDGSGRCFGVDEAGFHALGGIKVAGCEDPFPALEVRLREHVKDITNPLSFGR